MTPYTISVIICAFTEERWQDLVAAVSSVETQTMPASETIVVIDHNSRLLARARAQFARATVIENDGPQGLSSARNAGIAIARGEIVAFLDDDACAARDWLERISAAYDDPRVAGVGGAIVPRWDDRRPAWFPHEFDWVVGCTYRGHRTQRGSVRNLIGANMSFRRSVFKAVGGFRNGVGQVGASMLRCDDTELCIRVRQVLATAFLLHEPRAIVSHRVPPSRTTWPYFRSRCYTEGMAKSLIARLVGSEDALSSERAYMLRALPPAIARGIIDAAFHRDLRGLARAATVIVGLGLATAGYVTALIGPRITRSGCVTSGEARP
jgi:GT2 family glycosyltransferase